MKAKFNGLHKTNGFTQGKVYNVACTKKAESKSNIQTEDMVGDSRVIAEVVAAMRNARWTSVWFDLYYFIGDNGVVYGYDKSYWEDVVEEEPSLTPKRSNKCECGAWVTNAPASLHSTWCPEFAMFKPVEQSEVEKCKMTRKSQVNSVLSGVKPWVNPFAKQP
jgi:hypothetical protein